MPPCDRSRPVLFAGAELSVHAGIFLPEGGTEQLVYRVIQMLQALAAPCKVWDVGTGSGCIAAAIALACPLCKVVATDISLAAIACARCNLAQLGLADRVVCRYEDVRVRMGAMCVSERYDVIVCNLPYGIGGATLAASLRQCIDGGGSDGTKLLGVLIRGAGRHLEPAGILAVECDVAQLPILRRIAAEAGVYDTIVADAVVLGRARAGHVIMQLSNCGSGDITASPP